MIIGHGPEEKALRPILGEALARGTAHIQPDVDHVRLPNWYRTMDLFVMPSRYENFSNAALEALACGIPLLGSDAGGNNLLAEEGRGWTFRAESIPALAASLAAILRDRDERLRRAAASLDCVRQRHSWAASAERLEFIIQSRLKVCPDTNTSRV